jgi:hypothetical protein
MKFSNSIFLTAVILVFGIVPRETVIWGFWLAITAAIIGAVSSLVGGFLTYVLWRFVLPDPQKQLNSFYHRARAGEEGLWIFLIYISIFGSAFLAAACALYALFKGDSMNFSDPYFLAAPLLVQFAIGFITWFNE